MSTDAAANGNNVPFAVSDWLIGELQSFVAPLLAATETTTGAADLLANIGWQASAVPALAGLVQDASTAVSSALNSLYEMADGGSGAETALNELKALLKLAEAISNAISGLSHSAFTRSQLAGLDRLGEDLLAWMTDAYLRGAHPLAHGVLMLLTLLTPQEKATQQPPVVDGSGQTVRTAYRIPSMHLDRVGSLLRNPQAFLRSVYLVAGTLNTPDTVNALADALFPPVAEALKSFGLGANYGLDPYFELGLDATSTALLDHSLTVWLVDSADTDAAQLGVTIALIGPDSTTNNQVAAVVAPQLPPDLAGSPIGGWTIGIDVGLAGGPLSVVGWNPYPADPGGWPGLNVTVTLTAGQFSAAGIGTGTSPSGPSAPGAQISLGVSVTDSSFNAKLGFAAQATISANPGDFGDGFLNEVLPSGGWQIPVAVEATGSRSGFQLQGSMGQGSAIVLGRLPSFTLGPITVEDCRFEVTPTGERLTAAAYVSIGLSIGPINANIQDLGIGLAVSWPSSGGNAGPFNLAPEIIFPAGLGLSVDAPLVSGGGYLATDPASGTYLGALALSVGTVSVQGVGVLTTRLAGGGWSLVALADVEGLAVQLGFGIELTGVGILVGVNRTMNVSGLQGLARSGGLRTVMFPVDLAANAPRVAADLESLFPTAKGQYVFGPTVQLVWGSGSLITGEVAVYVELPSPIRIAVLGSLQIALPEPEAPVVQLNLDLLGVIDLTAKTLSLDMSLSHSQLAGMPLSGQAALRAGWGSQPEFLLAVGGFNPHFTPPAGFPPLSRIGLTLGSGNLQLRLTSYLAVTSNTLQFGAALDLRASAGPASLTATVSFDALIQYKPFALQVDLSIVAAITLGGSPVLSLNISAQLTGPNPWHISGKAHFSVLFFSFTIPISGTFGASTPPALPATVDVIGPLAAAVADPHSWTLSAPPGTPAIVAAGGAASSLVHPLGAMTLSQRVVPLEQTINRFGADVLAEPMSLRLSAGGATTASTPVTAYFAPAQFVTMTDAQRLSAPSFEPLTAGFTIGDTGYVVPVAGGTSATRPQAPPVSTPSTAKWDAQVVNASPGPAAPQTTTSPQVAVPAVVLAAQLPDAAASTSAAITSATGRYTTGPQQLIGPRSPSYSIASLALTTPAAINLGSNVNGLTQLRPGQQILFNSELHPQPL